MKKHTLLWQILMLAVLTTSNILHAQNFSTKGKDFWIGFMFNYKDDPSKDETSIYVSSKVNTTGTLYLPGQPAQNFSVIAGITTKLPVPLSFIMDTPFGSFPNGGPDGEYVDQKGIRVVTADSCNVFALNYAVQSADAIVALPTAALGTLYNVITHNTELFHGEFMVVAPENNTTFEIYNAYGSLINTVTLNSGQAYFRKGTGADYTGWRIKSITYFGNPCKPVAVFSGNSCTNVGSCGGFCDHQFEQMYPVDTWGYNFATSPFKTRVQDLIKVVFSQNNTKLYRDGVLLGTYNEGQSYSFKTGTARFISGDKPIAVTQFSLGSQCDGVSKSDPFMIVLSPVEQTLPQLTFNAYTSTIITNYYLNVITKTANKALVTLDGVGVNPASFNTVPGNTLYSYAQLDITQGDHTVSSDSGVTAIVYGYGIDESYGYAAGASLKNLANFKISSGPYCTSSNITFTSDPPDPTITNWNWNFGDGTSTVFTTNSSTTHSFAAPGTYTVSMIIQKSTKCDQDTVKKTITINGFGASIPTGNVTNILCNGLTTGSAQVSLTGGTAPFTYTWSASANGQTTAQATGLSAGTHSVTINDQSGCPNTQTVTITQPSTVLSISTTAIDSVDCFGQNNGSIITTVNSTGTGPYTYSWSNGQTTATATNLVAGSYTLQVTDANGCTAVNNSYNVGQPAAPLSALLNAGQTNILCYGNSTGNASVTVSGGTTNYTYSWNNGQTTSSLSNVGAGTYSVVVTDKRGCTATVSGVSIIQPTQLLVAQSSVTVATCGQPDGGASVSINGGTKPYVINWSNGATDSIVGGLAAGPYNVTITDANNCVASTIAVVTNANGPSGTLSVSSHVNCFGESTGSATAVGITGGTSPYTYSWSDGQTTMVATGLSAGQHAVVVEDATGCKHTPTIIINQPSAALNVTIVAPTNILCLGVGQAGGIQTTTAGGTQNYTYSWSNGASTSGISNLPAGNYSVLVTDANACTDSESITITEPSQQLIASASTLTSVKCYAGVDGAATITVTGDPSLTPYTYSWSNGATNSSLTNVSAGTYTVTVTDKNSCQDTALIVITQPQNPLAASLNGSVTNVLCNGYSTGSATVQASGGTQNYTYSWNNGQTGVNVTGLSSGSYTVLVTDANNCTTNLSISIAQPSSYPDAIITPTNAICFGTASGNISALGTGGTFPFNYLWNDGQTTNSISGLAAGTYSVLITDGNGCTVTKSVDVTQPVLVVPGATANPMEGDYPLPVNFVSTTQNADSIWWNFGDGSPITGGTTPSHTYTDDGTYTVWQYTVANQICRDSIQLTIIVEEPVVINVPNVFTPNGDGANDLFTVVTTGIDELHGDIYDRWGLKMYSWDGVSGAWDGTSAQTGKFAPSGTYYYVIKTLDNEDQEVLHKGYLQLIR